ncbi:Hypothetical protein NTJ_05788 [Nesidiocoris tenuis]|uniref:Uncharacterized protein n=1 Tax=Nesidiocoris tenuis TaxID=355587 RepID=A0ABN7AL87_9HEMI|nr:Hypothetical protein NTJ_05788 [Nesidiocoris tenuis]
MRRSRACRTDNQAASAPPACRSRVVGSTIFRKSSQRPTDCAVFESPIDPRTSSRQLTNRGTRVEGSRPVHTVDAIGRDLRCRAGGGPGGLGIDSRSRPSTI